MQLLRLLLRVTDRLASCDGQRLLGGGRRSPTSISGDEKGGRTNGAENPNDEADAESTERSNEVPQREDSDSPDETDDSGADGEGRGYRYDENVGNGYLPETLQATTLLLSRLQAVMTRAWDPSEVSPITGVSGGSDNSSATAAEAAAASLATPWAFVGRPTNCGAGSAGGAGGGMSDIVASTPGPNSDDPLADTFMGSTRRIRKWDWVRCCHSPVNPVLAAGKTGAGGAEGGSPQPEMAPVAIDPNFCHRTLRPGKPGPEGCTLEQVRWSDWNEWAWMRSAI